MKGEITDVEWSFHSGVTSGVITGEDGKIYNFGRTQWRESSRPQIGTSVDFVADENCVSVVKRFDYRSSSDHTPTNGFVLYFDRSSREGTISGNDGKQYRVTRLDWRDAWAPEPGRTVDFVADGDRARDVRRVAHTGAYPKSKIVAALLALFLGMFGVHKFYLGFTGQGVIMVISTIAGITIFFFVFDLVGFLVLGAVAVVSFTEFVTYLTRSDEGFHETYFVKKQRWF